jgi:hypothetical protein
MFGMEVDKTPRGRQTVAVDQRADLDFEATARVSIRNG